MARVTYVKKAQARYKTVPAIDPETGTQKIIPVLKRDGTPKTTRKTGRPIVRRLTVEDKNQPLPNLKCGKCSKEIKPGDPYKWVKPKSGPYGGTKRVRCATCPTWRPSELTSSGALSTLYAAQEEAEDALNQWDREDRSELESILETLAEGVREAGNVYRESAENMESGFGHATSTSDELNEKADALDSAADDVEAAVSDLEDWDEDAARQEVLDETAAPDVERADEYDWEADPEDLADDVQAKKDEWADAQTSVVEDAISGIEV